MPTTRGGRYFYTRNDGLQNQGVLYTADVARRPSRACCSTPTRSADDGTVALSGTAISDDGKLLAYGLAAAGTDWQEWRVRDVETGKDLSDHLKWIKFSGASWTPDSKGFFYSRYDEPKAEDRVDRRRTTFRSCTTTAWARRSPKIGWSTSGPTKRNGASTAR